MTYEEFRASQTDNAFNAVLNDSEFKRSFMLRLSDPSHQIREWEEEVVSRLMALSYSQV